MAKDRKRLAAALAYVDEKAKRLTSLDQPKESDAVDMALEMGGSFIPGVGQALAARDFERARRADDEAGMAMAAASALPVGRLIGALKGFDPVMREIDVYHGSPHVFDEFDASKIGTGEGAQAYGHGIYLAESPKVAASYRSQLAPGTIRTIDGGDYDPANPEHIAAKYLNTFSQRNYSLQKIADLLEEDASLLQQEGHKKAAEIVRSGKIEKLGKVGHRPSGALYTADLPDEMVDRMLDWDKPLSEQPELARYLENLTEMKTLKSRGKDISNLTGKQFYDLIADSRSHWRRDASAGLAEIGIPGIKYMDEGSRGYVVDLFHKGKPYAEHLGEKYPTLQSAQQRITEARAEGFEPKLGTRGTRNFVVFPGEEKKVKILKRE